MNDQKEGPSADQKQLPTPIADDRLVDESLPDEVLVDDAAYAKKPLPKKWVIGISVVGVLLVAWWLLGKGNGIVVAGKGHDEKMAVRPEKADGADKDTNKQKSIPDIVVVKLVASNYQPTLQANGVSIPLQQSTIKSAIGGRVEKRLVVENTLVKAGTPIIRFKPEANVARLDAIEKQVKLLEISRNSEQQLARQGLSSQLNMAQAESQLANARAQLAEQRRVVNELLVKAPFDGIVTTFAVEANDLVGPSQPLADFSALQELYIDSFISAERVRDVRVGMAATVNIFDHNIAGTVTYVGEVSDQQTSTTKVRVRIKNPDGKIRGQVPAAVSITLPTVKAQQIPSTALSLNDNGQVGVKLLDKDNKVIFSTITILEQGDRTMWVSGLPEQAILLSDGQAFVVAGNVINPVYKDDKNNSPTDANPPASAIPGMTAPAKPGRDKSAPTTPGPGTSVTPAPDRPAP